MFLEYLIQGKKGNSGYIDLNFAFIINFNNYVINRSFVWIFLYFDNIQQNNAIYNSVVVVVVVVV